MKFNNIKSAMICAALSLTITACGNDTKEEVMAPKADTVTVNKSVINNATDKSVNLVEAIYQEGVHYTVLEKPIFKPANHVMELFSFTCPHCYKAENVLMNPWKKEGGNVKFEVLHSVYDLWAKESKVFYTLEKLSREDLYSVFFSLRQSIRGPFSDKALDDFIISSKLDQSSFYNTMNSVEVKNKIAQVKTIEDNLKTGSVPTFLIGGKYLINNRVLKSFNDIKTLSEYLISNKP